jgi:hypothetical protein
MKSHLILAGVILALASNAQAQPRPANEAPVTNVQTVADLARVCDPSRTGVPRLEAIAYCQGFLTSFGQYHALAHPPGRPGQLFCLPNPGPTIAESGLAFARWSRTNAQSAGEPAADGLLRWAEATYPCPTPDAAARRTPRNAR